MRKYLLLTIVLFVGFASCKDDEDVNVIRDITVTNDGEEYTAKGNRFMYIFKSDGEWVANYDQSEKFILDDGTYHILCAKAPVKFPVTVEDVVTEIVDGEEQESVLTSYLTNLKDLFVEQSADGVDTLTISDVVTYKVPNKENLRVDMTTRTGRIGFVSLDTKPEYENPYNRIRLILKVKQTGYKVQDGTYITGDMEVVREANTNGGIGVKELFAVFPTGSEENQVILFVEYYNDEELVTTRKMARTIEVQSGRTSLVSVFLNDPDPHVITDFDITITDDPWTEDVTPLLPPLEVPEGYTLVPADGDLLSYINNAVSETGKVKLVLTPGGVYDIASVVCKNDIHLLGGKQPGLAPPKVVLSRNWSVQGADVKSIVFEGVDIDATAATYMFNNGRGDADRFHLDELKYIDCNLRCANRTIFRVQGHDSGAAATGLIDKILIKNCIFEYGSGGWAMFRTEGSDNNIFKDFEAVNSTFIILPGTAKVLCEGTGTISGEMKFAWTNCTFVTASDTQLFGTTVATGGTLEHVVENCLFGGENGAGRGYQTGAGAITYSFLNNYCVQGWSFDRNPFPVMPTETVSHSDLFADPAAYDFTIKDVNSEVYKQGIGDPRWIK